MYPLILYDFFSEISLRQPQLQGIIDARGDFLFYLFTIQMIFILIVFIVTIFMTHKVAGPMYKLKAHLSDIRQGHPISKLTFRSGDHFHDVAEEVSLFLETVAINQENDFQYLDEVATYIENLANVVPDDKKPVLNEISRRLIDIQSRYKKPL